jgi:hypothetical protein
MDRNGSPTLQLDFKARYCFEPELFGEAAQRDTEPTERLTLADVPWRAAANGRVSECTDYGVEVQKVCT